MVSNCRGREPSREFIDLAIPESNNHESAKYNHLEYLSEEWIRLHEAYFAVLYLKDKKMGMSIQDTEDLERNASLKYSFQEMENEVILEGNLAIKNIISNLVRRKNLQRRITCSEGNLHKITTHPTIRMFTVADLRLEFELRATPFWKDWNIFENLMKNTPIGTTHIHLANTILSTHGKESLDMIHKLKELFKRESPQ